jgi:UPF0755 protein
MAYGSRVFNDGSMGNLKRLIRIFILATIFPAAAAAWITVDMLRFARHPAGSLNAPQVINILPGDRFARLTSVLEANDIITSGWRFQLLARVRGDDKRLKAGEYALSASMTPTQVLEVLVAGKVLLHRFMIPEGYTIAQIAAEIERAGLADAQTFKALASDSALAAELGLEAAGLEGYLFPNTYHFPKGLSERDIIKSMVDQFHRQLPEQWRIRAAELGFSLHQLVTLASIIEKETGHPSERTLVASVFHNRLQRKMRLESDPTAVYGLDDFDGKVTRLHLRTDTPFNTYRIPGLPPGPIANPGRASIEAALYPAQTDFLFFVSKRDGTHHFSTTLEEHNRAIRKYLMGR